MLNRLKRSQRPRSVDSTKSAKASHQASSSNDSAHLRHPSAPDDSPRTSIATVADAVPNDRDMGIDSAGSIRGDKLLPTLTAMTTYAQSSPSPALSFKSAQLNNTSGANDLTRRLSTIRTVTSFDDQPRQKLDDESSSAGSPSNTKSSDSTFSSSVNSILSNTSNASRSHSPSTGNSPHNNSTNHKAPPSSIPAISYVSSPDGPSAPSRNSIARLSAHYPSEESSLSQSASKVPVATSMSTTTYGSPSGNRPGFANLASNDIDDRQTDSSGANGWDSTVGKAALGKTGRVINRLVSDNEALKRDLKIESLKAEEAKQAARLVEDKMERLIADYESRLMEANLTKTLLARKERQVESLQSAVQLEKKRTTDAQDRERTWREEMEKIRSEAKRQVEEATGYAALMEGRYNAISSHWRDQGETVQKAVARMEKDVLEISEARQQDDEKINMLRDLCDQQDGNIKLLCRQKDNILHQFSEYKKEQENFLHDIKANATQRELEQENTLSEARDVLDKLKWSLNIKNTIDWAS
ncbi:mother-specific HO expression [Sporothrix epigloea]|uniref:Mother-specific HO expression n=1 Tax=Sporothrix epigloea TaxID=1892477 RepID=A0ABP0DMJ7_9PEZI